jgi:hypothetical protein
LDFWGIKETWGWKINFQRNIHKRPPLLKKVDSDCYSSPLLLKTGKIHCQKNAKEDSFSN